MSWSGAGMSVGRIAEMANDCAAEWAPDLLPNGRRSGGYWMASGIDDSGRSESLCVHLSGAKIGKWFDYGNATPGQDKGDMLDLLRLRLGLADAAAAIQEAKNRLGISDEWKPARRRELSAEERERLAAEARARVERRQAEELKERTKSIKFARALYLGGNPIAGTPAEAYLRGRELAQGSIGKWPSVLRYHPEISNKDVQAKVPAMLAAVYMADGTHVATHRTFLQRDPDGRWGKLAVPKPKKVVGPMWGGFIPISKGSSGKSMRQMPEGEPVYVTEGIEDALVVRMMKPEVRIITAISLGNMGAIVLPPAARELVIVCDRDNNDKARDQLERSIAQQQARGLRVRMVIPPEGHKDMNDWLRALKARPNPSRGAA